MYVRSIKLRNYRNYNELNLELSPSINIFLGANAQGKTNIVEAVCYASWAVRTGRMPMPTSSAGRRMTRASS